jgi:hypothetical protein
VAGVLAAGVLALSRASHAQALPEVSSLRVRDFRCDAPDAIDLDGLASWQRQLLLMLNRRDERHLERGDCLVVPQAWIQDELAYSPLPARYPAGALDAKLLVVHQPGQVFGAYELGRLVRWGPVSSGRAAHPTPTGRFHLNWKSSGRRSTVNPRWYMPWYFNFENRRGLAFHAYSLPGLPASHACIRLLEQDARWLHDWGDEWVIDERGTTVLAPGTPVLILGEYDFGHPPVWQSTTWLARGIDLDTASATAPPGSAP